MPIRESEKARYPSDWKCIVAEVKERANHRCEFCKVKNYELISRHKDGHSFMLEDGSVHDAETGEYLGCARGSEWPSSGKIVKVVLTIAHLNHTPEDNGESGNRPNLKALCQRCHLRYDSAHHQKNAAETRRRKMNNTELFAGA